MSHGNFTKSPDIDLFEGVAQAVAVVLLIAGELEQERLIMTSVSDLTDVIHLDDNMLLWSDPAEMAGQ